MARILLVMTDGVIEEVLSDDPKQDVEFILLDRDEAPTDVMFHYEKEVMMNPDWKSVPTQYYAKKFMPLVKHVFKITLDAVNNSKDAAWKDVYEALRSSIHLITMPEEYDTESVIIPDSIYLECSLCGLEEEVFPNSSGGWQPECYIRDEEIGAVCPACITRHCIENDDGFIEVDLDTLDFTALTSSSPILSLIKKRFTKKSSTTQTER